MVGQRAYGVVAEADEIVEGYGIHDCCCEHIVEQIEAAPMPSKAERYAQTREQYYACPHKWLTPLEVYLGTLR